MFFHLEEIITTSFLSNPENRGAFVQIFANTTESLTNEEECSFCANYPEINSVADFAKESEKTFSFSDFDSQYFEWVN